MKHVRSITVTKASAKQDAAGLIFLQIWLSVMTAILSAAFKD